MSMEARSILSRTFSSWKSSFLVSKMIMGSQCQPVQFCLAFLSEGRMPLKGENYLSFSIEYNLKRGLACDIVIGARNLGISLYPIRI